MCSILFTVLRSAGEPSPCLAGLPFYDQLCKMLLCPSGFFTTRKHKFNFSDLVTAVFPRGSCLCNLTPRTALCPTGWWQDPPCGSWGPVFRHPQLCAPHFNPFSFTWESWCRLKFYTNNVELSWRLCSDGRVSQMVLPTVNLTVYLHFFFLLIG